MLGVKLFYQSRHVSRHFKIFPKINLVRFNHQDSSAEKLTSVIDDDLLAKEIPLPPTTLNTEEFEAKVLLLKDTLSFYDLDSYWPSGLIRSGLCFLHDSTGLSWVATIAIGVFAGRLITIPSTISNARTQAVMQKYQPQYKRMQERMNEARATGDMTQMQLAQFEMAQFDKGKGVGLTSKIKAYMIPMAYFLSFFIAIKKMCSAPLESMRTGGCLWFTDLASVDPTWSLSLILAATTVLTMRSGLDMPMVGGGSARLQKIISIGLPSVALFVTHRFESGVVCYWIFTNLFTLSVVSLLKVPAVRTLLKLPPRLIKLKELKSVETIVEPRTQVLKKQAKKIVTLPFTAFYAVKKFFKDNFSKLAPNDGDILRKDAEAFQKAGHGPMIATYPYNPKEKFPEVFKPAKTSKWKNFFARKSN